MSNEITAEQAGSIGISMEECEIFIDQILSGIYADIKVFPATTGWNTLKYNLPIQFNMPSDDTPTKKSNRQIVIYGNIIKRLRSNGYTVRIAFSERKNTLYIRWESNYDCEMFAALQAEIKRYQVDGDDAYEKELEAIKPREREQKVLKTKSTKPN